MTRRARIYTTILFISMVSISLAGCGTTGYGTPINAAAVKTIKKGVTTREEVVKMLGQPMNEMMMPDGSRIMTYSYSQSAAIQLPFTTKNYGRQSLQIDLSNKGIVTDYQFNNTSMQVNQGLGAWGGGSVRVVPNASPEANHTLHVQGTNATAPQPDGSTMSVSDMQNHLNALGYTVGKADGDFGPRTRRELERFQHDHNLTVTGSLNPETIQALQK